MKTSKEKIVQQAATLFFDKGYETTSTRDIAAAVGLSNASCLFSHFRGKEEIFRAVVDRFIINAQLPKQKFGECEGVSLYDFIEIYVQNVERTKQLLRATVQNGDKASGKYLSFILECAGKYEECAQKLLQTSGEEIELWETVIENARQSGEIAAGVNAGQLAEVFRYAFMGITYQFSMRNEATSDELRAIFYNIYNMVKSPE